MKKQDSAPVSAKKVAPQKTAPKKAAAEQTVPKKAAPKKSAAPAQAVSAPAAVPIGTGSASKQEFVSQRAYYYYESRGRMGGHELDDWLKAEAEFERMTTAEARAGEAAKTKPT
jgi:hypothetical protein